MTSGEMPCAKPRLLVVTSTFPRWKGDAEPAFVFELCRRLASDFQIRVLAPHAKGAAVRESIAGLDIWRYQYAPERFELLAHGGGIVPNLRKHRWRWILVPFFLLFQFLAIRRHVKEWRPEVVHAHWIIPQGLIAGLALGKKRRGPTLFTTSHGADLFALKGRWFERLKRFVLSRSDQVTVVSEAMRNEVLSIGVAGQNVRVAPMGVDLLETFVPDPQAQRSSDEILFVGRLVEKKGLRYLLDALPALINAYPGLRLTVAGFGPEEQALRERAASLGLGERVVFLGPVAQATLPALYRRAAVFVAPFVRAKSGDQEGLGLVVVEAVGCGCPVVVSDLPAVRDVVGVEGERFLVGTGDSDALSKRIARVLEDPHEACSEAMRLRDDIMARFDWAVVARNYCEIIGSLVRQ
jgi:glycosyltransferase involved in cell wall biosynthesis